MTEESPGSAGAFWGEARLMVASLAVRNGISVLESRPFGGQSSKSRSQWLLGKQVLHTGQGRSPSWAMGRRWAQNSGEQCGEMGTDMGKKGRVIEGTSSRWRPLRAVGFHSPSSLCAWATGRCQRRKAALGPWKQSAESWHLQRAGCASVQQEKVREEDVRWGSRRGL